MTEMMASSAQNVLKVYSGFVLELSEFKMRMVVLKGSLDRQGNESRFKNGQKVSLVVDFPLELCETEIDRREQVNWVEENGKVQMARRWK